MHAVRFQRLQHSEQIGGFHMVIQQDGDHTPFHGAARDGIQTQ